VEDEVEQAVAFEIAEADHAGGVEALADRARIERGAGRTEMDLEQVAVGGRDQIEPSVGVEVPQRGQEADGALVSKLTPRSGVRVMAGFGSNGSPAPGGRSAAPDRSSA
jgi:hypothetical protein